MEARKNTLNDGTVEGTVGEREIKRRGRTQEMIMNKYQLITYIYLYIEYVILTSLSGISSRC